MKEQVQEVLDRRERRDPLLVELHESNVTEEREREELAENDRIVGASGELREEERIVCILVNVQFVNTEGFVEVVKMEMNGVWSEVVSIDSEGVMETDVRERDPEYTSIRE